MSGQADIPRIALTLTVNGVEREAMIEPRDLLVDVLRDRFGLKGTKRSCDVQVCGACTVLIDGMPASSCSTLAADAQGRSVLTIEGVAQDGVLDPVQRAFVEHGALQCGFCTPGFVLAVKALFATNPAPTDAEIKHFLRGNICRCTGYVKILDAVKSLV
jgi:aerobic carbon-monoxide dehydrogenase small subunit